MSTLNPTSKRYAAANEKWQEVYDKYSGENGLKLAANYASQQAGQQASLAGANAGAEANIAARTAGLNKARAALTAQDAVNKTASNTYSNVYNAANTNALTTGNNAIGAAQTHLTTEQNEANNEFDKTTKELSAGTTLISDIIKSDARLKDSVCISSNCNTTTKLLPPIPSHSKGNEWELLKVTYKGEKK